MREVIRRDLEDRRGIGQAVDLVQNDRCPAIKAGEESFGIIELPADAGQFTIEILEPGKGLGEDGLSCAPHPHEPHQVTSSERGPKPGQPERALYHPQRFLRLVLPDAIRPAFGKQPRRLRNPVLILHATDSSVAAWPTGSAGSKCPQTQRPGGGHGPPPVPRVSRGSRRRAGPLGVCTTVWL